MGSLGPGWRSWYVWTLNAVRTADSKPAWYEATLAIYRARYNFVLDTDEDQETVHLLLPPLDHLVVELFDRLCGILPHLGFLFFTELLLELLPQFLLRQKSVKFTRYVVVAKYRTSRVGRRHFSPGVSAHSEIFSETSLFEVPILNKARIVSKGVAGQLEHSEAHLKYM